MKIEKILKRNQVVLMYQITKVKCNFLKIEMAARRIGLEEVKRPRQTGFTNKPSDKLARKVADPFRPKKKNKTNFGYVYTAGGIPCRIFHQSVSMKL